MDTKEKEQKKVIKPSEDDQSKVIKPSEPEQTEEEKEESKKKSELKMQIIQMAKTTDTGIMSPIEYQQMKWIAKDLMESGAIPQGYKNVNQVLMAIMAGAEMGMKPIESMNSLYIVNGSINVWGKATTRRLREHGFYIQYKDETDESVTVIAEKKGGLGEALETYEETYKYEDAKKSGYTSDNYGKQKFGWKEGFNRKIKLRYGALSMLIKTYIPEVLGSADNIVEVAQEIPKKIIEDRKIEPKKIEVKNGNLAGMVKGGK